MTFEDSKYLVHTIVFIEVFLVTAKLGVEVVQIILSSLESIACIDDCLGLGRRRIRPCQDPILY